MPKRSRSSMMKGWTRSLSPHWKAASWKHTSPSEKWQARSSSWGRRTLTHSGNWNLSLNLDSILSSKPHASPKAWKALTSQGTETTLSTSTPTGLSLDNNPISNSLDLTSDIALRSLNKPSNQSIDWLSNGNKLPNTTPKLLPLETKFVTEGRKTRKYPKKPLNTQKRNKLRGRLP